MRTGFNGHNNSTYNSLVQSGEIGILNDALIKDLSNLHNQQKISINSQQDHWIIYLEKIQEFNANFPNNRKINLIDDGPLQNYLREQRDDKSFIIGFNEIFIAKRLMYFIGQNNHKTALYVTQEILKNHF